MPRVARRAPHRHGQRKRAPGTARTDLPPLPIRSGWSARGSVICVAVATLLLLVPFSGKAFHIDDPLFVWAAQHIAHHPLDPYGFNVVWYVTEEPMSEVTKNPPLASYVIAVVGSLAGWSERALHIAFLLPAVGVVLGTYLLARRFCRTPLLAAMATLVAPGFLVSACSVMCDTLMLALWLFATVSWLDGLDDDDPMKLAFAGLLIAASALTKYFGASLIPLLFTYSAVRRRGLGNWAWYFLIPIAILAGYQAWTRALYGRGLLLDAAEYANATKEGSAVAQALIALVFTGGCMVPALAFVPRLWSRTPLLVGALLGAMVLTAIGLGWIPGLAIPRVHRGLVTAELALGLAGGASALGLTVADLAKRRDAASALLTLWVLGTFAFAGLFNWTVNARSLLPLIPAAAILLARRLEMLPQQRSLLGSAAALAASAIVSLGVAQADAALANAQRTAAGHITGMVSEGVRPVWFQGHWGFQYYMQARGARPMDLRRKGAYGALETSRFRPGDLVVVPEHNTNTFEIDSAMIASRGILEERASPWLTTMNLGLGAGFYSSGWGPLPYAIGRVPPERYQLLRLKALSRERAGGGTAMSSPR